MLRSSMSRTLRGFKYSSVEWTAGARYDSTISKFVRISEEIQQAVQERRPIVALESTIYTHGYPSPENLALAARLDALVRQHGAVPATIGILDGIARVGMGAEELTRLVSPENAPNVRKVSRRDLGFVCGSRGSNGRPMSGGTTIAGTMILAHMAGIRVFATGGLGGVHRGAESTMDISADLTELGRTPVAVISSGCKAFLDISKTLEYLETQGVAVATFADGRTGNIDFPAFWTRDSGISSPMTLQNEEHAAQILYAHFSLGLRSGLHFANPIPAEHEIPLADMKIAIDQAHAEAHAAGCTGAATTPFILAKIKELTGSRSMTANTALAEGNVIRGARVAVALRHLEERDKDAHKSQEWSNSICTSTATMNHTSSGDLACLTNGPGRFQSSTTTKLSEANASLSETASLFVAGSMAVDLSCNFAPPLQSTAVAPQQHTSNPAKIEQSLGGVGHNIARAAHLMGANVRLCSVVGDDLSGQAALQALDNAGVSNVGVKVLRGGVRTAQYVSINDANKDLVVAMADFDIFSSTRSSISSNPEVSDNLTDTIQTFWLPQLRTTRPTHVALDGNWSPAHLATWMDAAKSINAHITFEPVSTLKSTALFQLPSRQKLGIYPKQSVDLATPNSYELAEMYTAARSGDFFDRPEWWSVVDALGIPSSGARTELALATSNSLVDQGIPQQCIQLLPFIPCIATKLGAKGVLLTQLLPAGDVRLTNAEYAPFILSRCTNGTEDELGVGGVYMRLFPAAEKVDAADVISVNGVGDTFAGTLLAGLARRGSGARVEDFIDIAQHAAVLTLKSKESVAPNLGTMKSLLS